MKITSLQELGILISLTGDVNETMVRQFDTAVEKLLSQEGSPNEKKATILLSTVGGSVLDGEALSERIRFISHFVDLRIIAMTYVMSAGVRIFLALPRERRFVSPGTIIMIHPMRRTDDAASRQTIRERVQRLTEELLEARHAERREREWVKTLAKEMGVTYKTVRELWETSHRFSARQAVESGLASAVIKY